jgi:hypothetical protein
LIDVTIGLAAYNSAKTLAAALDSLLAQSHQGLKLLVSDNASTDGSAEICAMYAARNPRIEWVRRSSTVPVAENFRELLERAETPYFMWAAADDLWAPTFVARNRAVLEAHPEFVASQSRVLFAVNGHPTRLATGTFKLDGDPTHNVQRFCANPADNSRFYGLFRTIPLQRCFPRPYVHAFDWATSAMSLAAGGHNELDDVLMLRDETAAEKYADTALDYAGGALERALPLLPLTRLIIRSGAVPISTSTLLSLGWLNLRIALRYASLHVLVAARRDAAVAPTTSRGQLASGLARLLSPGMRERLADALRSRSAATSGQLKTYGWRSPLEDMRAEAGPACSIVIVTRDHLLDLLSVMDHIPAATNGLPRDITVIDLGSEDATLLLLAGRSDIATVNADPVGGAEAVVAVLRSAVACSIVILSSRSRPAPGEIAALVSRVEGGERAVGSGGTDNILALRRPEQSEPLEAAIPIAIARMLEAVGPKAAA